ncbi:MAG: ABC transporter ATP-binding protein [Oscillospiraceae bacterium]|nr:ABC transporter ATP-binding protein [Oscillospiraceae bacterium]
MGEPLICINNVYKIYNEGFENEVRALDGLNIRISQGEYVAIVGASGSGKTTLMNILGCLDQPTYGEYVLDGELVSALPDRKLARIRNRQIGFIFQGFNLLPSLNALENVELPLMYQGIRGARRRDMAEQALERVGLESRARHKPGEMSGGQQQRVAIARAIATNPPVIMADEPTGNLDSRTGLHVVEILDTLHADGATILLITHDSNVSAMARRQIRLSDGRVVESEEYSHGRSV